MFAILFYGWVLTAIWYEVWKLSYSNHQKVKRLEQKVKSRGKEETQKGKTFKLLSDDEKVFVFLMMFYALWTVIGLFTSQWILFLAIILLSQLHRIFKGYFWNVIDAVISIGILLFIIINRYHLHITAKEIWNYFV